MKVQKASFHLLFFCCLSGAFAQVQNFFKEYDVRVFENLNLINQNDSIFYACGKACNPNLTFCTQMQGFIAKFDNCGDTLWYKQYPYLNIFPTAHININSVKPFPGGGLIAVASEATQNPNRSWWSLIRMDSNGNIVWWRLMSSTSGNEGASLIEQLSDSQFVVSGNTMNNITYTNSESFVTVIDTAGNIQWSNRYYQGTNQGGSTTIGLEADTSSGKIYTCYYQSQSSSSHLVCVDPMGTMLWQKPFNMTIQAIDLAIDGSIVSIGQYWLGTFMHRHNNTNGDTIWKRKLLFMNYWNMNIAGLSTNEIAGSVNHNSGNGTGAVHKLDANGNFIYREDTVLPVDLRFDQIVRTTTGGYVIAGHRWDSSGNPTKLLLFKYDDSGCNPNTISENEKPDNFCLYPVPVSDELFLNHSGTRVTQITLYDITGKQVQLKINHADPEKTCFDIQELSSGAYFLQITSIKGSKTLRFIK